MISKSVVGSALLAFAVFATAPAFADGPDPTIHQVYQAAEAGKYAEAQTMMDKVLQDHPNSAKAHFVEAELLAKQAKLREAQVELNTAERLDPSLAFANKIKIQELQNRIAGAHPVVVQRMQPQMMRPAASPVSADSGPSWLTPVIVIGLVVLFFVIVRMISQRNTTVVGGGSYPVSSGYGPGAPMPGYGPGVMGGPVGGGIGSGILGGLATGAAVGAGIVAGEELMHHFTDHDRNNAGFDTPRDDSNWSSPPPDDMGGNDFGVSDSSSWDSGGGGGGGGGDDW